MQEPPLRIAFLADARSVHTRRWLGFFADRGHEIALLLSDDARADTSLDPRIEVHYYRPFGRRRIPFFSSLQGRADLQRLIAKVRPEILHAHYLSHYGWRALRAGFQPYVATGWGSDLLIDPGRSLRARFWAREVLRHAALVTVPSEHLAARAIRLGARPERLHRVPFGVDTQEFVPSDARAAIDDAGLGGCRIVFSPRAIRPLYRQQDVLRAVAGLSDELVVVMSSRNADLAYLHELQSIAADLGMADRLRVLGDIGPPLMRGLFQGAEVVVSVPISDGLPISVLEAMACGAPVAASDLPGPREALGPAGEEMVAPVGDVKALTRVIEGILAMDGAQRVALGKTLRQRVVDEFDFATCMARMENLYLQLRAAR